MLEVTANKFFEQYGLYYKRVFKLDDYEYFTVRATKIASKTRFFCFFSESNKLLAFCSFTEVDCNLCELGDVAKVSYKFTRIHFSNFLEDSSNFLHSCGYNIVGFPNSKALKLELDSGYSVISYYIKQPGFVFINLLCMLPFEFTPRGYKLNFRRMSLSFIKTPLKSTRRRYIISSNKHLSTRRSYFGIYLEYVKSSTTNDFPYISFKGKITRLLSFHESDNSI